MTYDEMSGIVDDQVSWCIDCALAEVSLSFSLSLLSSWEDELTYEPFGVLAVYWQAALGCLCLSIVLLVSTMTAKS